MATTEKTRPLSNVTDAMVRLASASIKRIKSSTKKRSKLPLNESPTQETSPEQKAVPADDALTALYFPGTAATVPIATFSTLSLELSKYLNQDQIGLIREAYRVSDIAHLGQRRASGEPYITHPLAVAHICAIWRLDTQAIQAALLHDVLEDTQITRHTVSEQFGNTVAEIVEGLSKLDKIEFSTREQQQAESFRKMLLAMSRDIRVVLIKLADRLHNMRTLEAVSVEKRRRIATETMDIYVPIAYRLGLNLVYRELQDLAFSNQYPLRRAVLARAVEKSRRNRRELIGRVMQSVEQALANAKLPVQVQGREKTLYGIYKKMTSKALSFSQVLDIYGVRVVVNEPSECYLALGIIHSLYKPVQDTFTDYIAMPKINGYQSLHTTVRGPYGTPVEFQIRTATMHKIAEDGVAAHWLYKNGESSITEVQRQTVNWMQSLLDIQSQTRDSSEFIENVKIDLFPDAVYVFTPKGKIIALPRGATALDFAYAVHTDIGNTCIAARINDEDQALRSELRNGDVVEITTSPKVQPNPAWLTFVRTGRARSEIRHALKSANIQEAIKLGERLIMQTFTVLHIPPDSIAPESWARLQSETNNKSREDLYAEVGQGKRLPAAVVQLLLRGRDSSTGVADTPGHPDKLLTLSGAEGAAVEFAQCCMPIPGDSIMAALGRGQGLMVHCAGCAVANRQRLRDPERWIDVAWADSIARQFAVRIKIQVREGKGVLARVASAIAQNASNILRVRNEEQPGSSSTMDLVIEVQDREHLAQVFRSLRRIPIVMRLERVRSGISSSDN